MKFEREATTKDGRRTWKVTYELVRGPEPKPKRQAGKPATSASTAASPPTKVENNEAKKHASAKRQSEKIELKRISGESKRAKGDGGQLGMF